MRPDCEGERRGPKERRADALVEMARFYLANHTNPPGAARPDRLVITADVTALFRAILRGAGVVTAAQLEAFLDARPDMGLLEQGLFLDAFDGHGDTARTLDGSGVSDLLLQHVTSNGLLERLLMAEGRILNHGRAVRVFTDTQRRAILARDQGCRVEGCDAGPEQCDIHHLNPFEAGGGTDIANGVAKCRREHSKQHRDRFTERLEPDGTYTTTSPTGTVFTSRPPGHDHQPRLPMHSTAEPAPTRPFRPEPPPERTTRRPRCDCACDHHRSPAEEAEHQHYRRLVLARFGTAA
jgi:hypothetical protein